MQELSVLVRRGGGSRKLLDLIEAAVSSGVLRVEDVDAVGLSSTVEIDRLAFTEAAVLSHAKRLRDAGDEAIVVSADRDVILAAISAGLEPLTPTDVWNRLEEEKAAPSTPIAVQASEVAREGRQQPRLLVLLGIAIGLAAVLVLDQASFLIHTLPVWGTFAGLTCLALALYWARGRYRLLYGAAEFAFGLAAAWIAARHQVVDVTTRAVAFLQVLAAVYVMVRGLDNAGKGIRATRYGEPWRRVFGEQ